MNHTTGTWVPPVPVAGCGGGSVKPRMPARSLITEVAPKSPAGGILEVGDVILGLGGNEFRSDARIALAKAITKAEEGSGMLSLLCWRDGVTKNLTLSLPIFGAYSPTAPYVCAKSARIFEEGCAVIAAQGFKNRRGRIVVSIPNDLNALALLASGKEEYQPLVKSYADAVADHTPGGHVAWGYAYSSTLPVGSFGKGGAGGSVSWVVKNNEAVYILLQNSWSGSRIAIEKTLLSEGSKVVSRSLPPE